MENNKKSKGNLILALPVIAGARWGGAGIFVRSLTDLGFGSLTIVSTRMLLSTAVFFVALMIYDRKAFIIRPKDIFLFISAGAVGVVFFNIGYNDAVKELTLSFAAVLLALFPAMVLVLARIIFKEKIGKTKAICSLLAIAGCTLVSGAITTGGLEIGTVSARGILMGLLATLCYAGYSIITRIGFEKGYSSLTLSFYSQLTASLILIPFTDWAVVGSSVVTEPALSLSLMIGNSILIAGLPYLLFNIALGRADTGKVSILAAGAEPSAAMIIGAIVYMEIPGIIPIAGLIITIVAMSVICKSGR